MKKKQKEKRKKNNEWLNKFDIFIPIIIILSLINPIRAAMSQYYILEYPDDIVWVHYAHEHFNNISGLLTDKIGTGFRPVINVLYYIGYVLWGSNEMYYYLMNGVLFASSMVFLYLLIKMLHSKMAGMFAVMLYLFLDASFILVWKMNYTTSIAEMFFITSSLYYSIHFFEKKDRLSLILAIILSILAFFSKEPSMVIIPTVNIIYLLHKKDMEISFKSKAIEINILPLIFLFIFTIYFAPEVSVSSDAPIIERVKERLVFYVEQELSWQLKNPYLFFLGIIGTFYFHKFDKDVYYNIPIGLIKNSISVFFLASAYIISQISTLYSLIGSIFVIFLLVIGFILGNSLQRIGIAWFSAGFAPLLFTTQIVQPTYLAEPNLGMSLFLGVTLSEYLKYIYSGVKQKNNISLTFNYIKIGAIILVILVQLSAVPTQIQNTNNYHNMVSDSQTSFKGAVDYIIKTVPQNGTIYYISTQERQKIGGGQINDGVFKWLLCFKGRCDIEIDSLDTLANNPEGHTGFVVLLSSLDAYIFINNYKELSSSNIFTSQKEIRNGRSVAYVLKMK